MCPAPKMVVAGEENISPDALSTTECEFDDGGRGALTTILSRKTSAAAQGAMVALRELARGLHGPRERSRGVREAFAPSPVVSGGPAWAAGGRALRGVVEHGVARGARAPPVSDASSG